MKRHIFFIILVFFCFDLRTSAQYQDIPTVNYCEIIKNPQNYNGKIVKIFAEQRSGFEFSGLGSQDCANDYGQIWAEWEKYESCGDEKTARLLVNRYKGIENNYLEGIFVGKFFVKEKGISGFGHMNAKPFQISISCVENATLLPKKDSGCTRVDETSPFHYLEYIKMELGIVPNYGIAKKKKKKENFVWFRLVNNSSCSIIVPTIGNQKEIRDKAETLVVYKLDPTIKTSDSTFIPKRGAIKTITNVVPTRSVVTAGNSVYFAVPLKFLKKSFKVRQRHAKIFWNICVPFEYADREKPENYDPFYFANSDLPKEIFKK